MKFSDEHSKNAIIVERTLHYEVIGVFLKVGKFLEKFGSKNELYQRWISINYQFE